MLLDFGDGNFFYKTPKAHLTKAKIYQWYYIRIKSFCTGKEIIDREKGNLWNKRT